MNSQFCFACAHTVFALPIQLFLSQPTGFLTSTLLIPAPSHQGTVPERLCGAELLARLNHSKIPGTSPETHL